MCVVLSSSRGSSFLFFSFVGLVKDKKDRIFFVYDNDTLNLNPLSFFVCLCVEEQ